MVGGLLFLYRYAASKDLKAGRAGNANVNQAVETDLPVAVVSSDIKAKIIQEPPVLPQPKISKLTQKTTTNSDGSSNTMFSSGQADGGDVAKAREIQTTINSPGDIIYNDQTGSYPLLGQVLKDYLSVNLRWSTEISSLKEIIVKDTDVKDTGWCGLYSGSYDKTAEGKVSSVSSVITINVYKDCYQNDDNLFNDYMKLILSHEYGHHYTLYHKWVDWGLLGDSRFPDNYYTLRNLDKGKTATDYSLGWANCDSEIIAEDYSYFYSGYGVDRVSSVWGYPSSSVKSWLESIAQVSGTSTSQKLVLSLTNPLDNQNVSGIINFSAQVSGGTRRQVIFYVDNNSIGELVNAPFTIQVDTKKYSNAVHIFKVVASDGVNTLESQANVTIRNQENDQPDITPPSVSFAQPKSNNFEWSGNSNLSIETLSDDNIGVTKLELYINDYLVFPNKSNNIHNFKDIIFTWPAGNVGSGEYTIKVIAWDAAGNKSEKSIKIIRIIESENQNQQFQTGLNINDNTNPNTNT